MTVAPRLNYFLVSVDVKGSSTAPNFDDHAREKLYRTLENCIRFFLANQDAEEADCWSGDGGFALLPQSHSAYRPNIPNFNATTAVKVASDIGEYAPHFISSKYLGGDDGPSVFQLRISVSQVDAVDSKRLSNVAGRAMNFTLKFERDLGNPGHLTLTEPVWEQYTGKDKELFVKRELPADAKQKFKFDFVYDRPIVVVSPAATNVLSAALTLKNAVDITTSYYLEEALANKTASINTLKVALEDKELLEEAIKYVQGLFSNAYQGKRFRATYHRYSDTKKQLEHVESCGMPAATKRSLDASSAEITASLAFKGWSNMFIPDTAAEHPATGPAPANPKFKFLNERQRGYLKSLACFPVPDRELYNVIRTRWAQAEGDKQLVERLKHPYGVLSIDTETVGFFDEKQGHIGEAVSAFVTELVLAEQLREVFNAKMPKKTPAKKDAGEKPAKEEPDPSKA